MFDKFSATVKSPPARCQPKRRNALFAWGAHATRHRHRVAVSISHGGYFCASHFDS